MTENRFNKIVGKNIKKYRCLYNINKGEMRQKDLAKMVGVSTSTIGCLESSKVTQGISLYNLYKISKALECTMDELIRG